MQRYSRNIEKNIKCFKAEELGSFLTRYLLPLVYGRVSEQTFRALQRLVFTVSKAVGVELTTKISKRSSIKWISSYCGFMQHFMGRRISIFLRANTQSMLWLILQRICMTGDLRRTTGSLQRFTTLIIFALASGALMWNPGWKRQNSGLWRCQPVDSHASASTCLFCN